MAPLLTLLTLVAAVAAAAAGVDDVVVVGDGQAEANATGGGKEI